jgi:hypothetical protein
VVNVSSTNLTEKQLIDKARKDKTRDDYLYMFDCTYKKERDKKEKNQSNLSMFSLNNVLMFNFNGCGFLVENPLITSFSFISNEESNDAYCYGSNTVFMTKQPSTQYFDLSIKGQDFKSFGREFVESDLLSYADNSEMLKAMYKKTKK